MPIDESDKRFKGISAISSQKQVQDSLYIHILNVFILYFFSNGCLYPVKLLAMKEDLRSERDVTQCLICCNQLHVVV